jgi:6-phosphogluconolactonase
MGAAPEFVVDSTAAQLADDVATRVVATLVAAQSVRPLAFLAVTGGGILEEVMTALRDLPSRDAVDWRRVSLWWGDERFVPADSDDRNDKAAFAKLFGALPLDPGNVHRMPPSDGDFGDNVDAAAEAYARALAHAVPADQADGDVPHFDIVLLGLGPDGLCASLFPDHPGVYEKDASVIAVRDSPKPPPTRISLTFRTLDAANEVWFIAAGSGKAHAVALAHSGAGREQVPSAGPHGRHRTLWLLDQEAAAELPSSLYRPPVS